MKDIFDMYVNLVKSEPFISAAVQFAVLGTLGEMISVFLRKRSISTGWSAGMFFGKIIVWAILGIVVKVGFIGMKGFTYAVSETGGFPLFLKTRVGMAFSISVFTNLFFGPQMMLFHRMEDNILERKWDFDGIKKAWSTLFWFWIPAHTLTFSLPTEFQIGLAAVWGLVLGIILGTAKNKKVI